MSIVELEEDIADLDEEVKDEDIYYDPYLFNKNNDDVFNSPAYNQLQHILDQAVKNWTEEEKEKNQKNNSFVDNIKLSEDNKMDNQQENSKNNTNSASNKCIKEAEEGRSDGNLTTA